MTNRIAPGAICRLEFAALLDGEPITDLVQADISSVAWETVTAGVASGTTGRDITLTGSIPANPDDSKSVGQLVDTRSADGIYAVDAPSTAADATADSVHLVVILSSGTAYAAEHAIDVAVSSRSSHEASDVAGLILVTPANKLATGAGGEVTTDDASRSASQATGFATSSSLTTLSNQIGTPAGASLAADVAAVQSDTTTLLSRVTTTVATLWANLTAMITGSGGAAAFTTTAMANAPAGGGGGSATLENQQSILSALITAGSVNVVSPVKSGGKISLIKGDDYLAAAGTSVRITVADAGGVLRGYLKDSGTVSSIIVGAGQLETDETDETLLVNQIEGTVDPSTIVANGADSDLTDIFLEFTAASTESTPSGRYRYHVKAVLATGYEITKVSDVLILEKKRADP